MREMEGCLGCQGTLREPHTGVEVPIGTLEIDAYLRKKPVFGNNLGSEWFDDTFPTAGPKNRYKTILYIEKEGFEELFKAVALEERFDISVMSNKGMSVSASRKLLDELCGAGLVERVFTLHDFDISGFSIVGTLTESGRRYTFKSFIPMIDLGLRLDQIREMNLESEPVVNDDDWSKRATTLRRHGATREEIEFLQTRRVELNAMTSRQLIDFIEAGLIANGVEKLISDNETLERQARRVMEHRLLEKAIEEVAKRIEDIVKVAELPADLRAQVEQALIDDPRQSWDEAVADIIRNNGESDERQRD
jgi:hypothetical protein